MCSLQNKPCLEWLKMRIKVEMILCMANVSIILFHYICRILIATSERSPFRLQQDLIQYCQSRMRHKESLKWIIEFQLGNYFSFGILFSIFKKSRLYVKRASTFTYPIYFGQWLWLSWQSGLFRNRRTTVQFQLQVKFYMNIF